jgi:hypothetical protein
MAVFWVVLFSLVCHQGKIIALMMEAASTPETSVNFYQTTQRNNPEDSHFHTRCHENLKSHQFTYLLKNERIFNLMGL